MYITGKYRGSAHRYCNINLKWNHIFPVILHNLQNYDSHLNVQELGKFNLTINVILNGLEKQMNFITNNKLSFIDSFQFLSSSLESLVKNFSKDDSKYLKEEYDNSVLYLVKQKNFILMSLWVYEWFWKV